MFHGELRSSLRELPFGKFATTQLPLRTLWLQDKQAQALSDFR